MTLCGQIWRLLNTNGPTTSVRLVALLEYKYTIQRVSNALIRMLKRGEVKRISRLTERRGRGRCPYVYSL